MANPMGHLGKPWSPNATPKQPATIRAWSSGSALPNLRLKVVAPCLNLWAAWGSLGKPWHSEAMSDKPARIYELSPSSASPSPRFKVVAPWLAVWATR